MNEYGHRKSPEDFKPVIDRILNRRLTPETLGTYAKTALDDLIKTTAKITDTYDKQPTVAYGEDTKEAEDRAYAYFELDDLESSLDHVANVADSIQQLDEVLNKSAFIDSVIVPPDTTKMPLQGQGNGEFEVKKIENRLKTTLFILEQDFEIDIHDPEQLRVTSGVIDESMMRSSSYYMLESPHLARTILVCDEEGNATYVFDSDVYEGEGASSELLISATKEELNDLLTAYPGMGRRIVYSKSFIANVKAALSNALELKPTQTAPEDETSYLQKNERTKWSEWSLDDIVALALELSPDVPLAYAQINDLSKANRFLSMPTIIKRFGSVAEFQRACGFGESLYRLLTNEQLTVFARELSPGIPLTLARINELSRADRFLSVGTIRNRFGSVANFQRACGFEVAEPSGFLSFTNEQLVALALELSPGSLLTQTQINELRKTNRFIGVHSITKRFGSLTMFQRACGFEAAEISEFLSYDSEHLAAFALELSPNEPLTTARINELSKANRFLSVRAIIMRFGSVAEFQRACGFEVADPSQLLSLTNEQLVALAQELRPGAPLTMARIRELSKAGKFLSTDTIIKRFGSLLEFQRACGF